MPRLSLLGAIEKFVIKKDEIRREVVTEGRIISITNRRALVSTDGTEIDVEMATDTPFQAGQRVVVGKDAQGQGYILGAI